MREAGSLEASESGLDSGGSNLWAASSTLDRSNRRLENRGFSAHWIPAVDGGGEGQAVSSGSNSVLFGVNTEGPAQMSDAAGFPVGSGESSSSLMRICSMLRVRGVGGFDGYPAFVPNLNIYLR